MFLAFPPCFRSDAFPSDPCSATSPVLSPVCTSACGTGSDAVLPICAFQKNENGLEYKNKTQLGFKGIECMPSPLVDQQFSTCVCSVLWTFIQEFEYP